MSRFFKFFFFWESAPCVGVFFLSQALPMMGIEAPVIAPASSDARNRMSFATSEGFGHDEKSASGIACLLAGVSIILGRTQFAVIPSILYSSEIVSVRRTTPLFETE